MRNVVLLASLAINIFLIGLVAGGQLFGGGARDQGPGNRPGVDQAMSDPNNILPLRAIQTLPPEHRRVARRTIEAFLPQSRALQEEIAGHRQKTVELLKQSSLDPEEFAATVDAMQAAQFKQQKLTADTIKKVLTDLPDAERIALLIRIEEFRKMQRETRQQEMRKRIGGEMRERMIEERQQREQQKPDDDADGGGQ